MSGGGLEARVGRPLDAINPQPARMLTVVILHLDPLEPADVRPPAYFVGRHRLALFRGENETE